ncbi:hypothetical protein HanXRQr2_Chr04g0181731 [Helianthus annuus]|uniref:Uncharacterized protein n=1 Tax=Helianthus annuus TaxID=4232 RepID=A0A9K3JAP4_HELAN|nr:hypothetical protein HanXRQr2_Chr04g0181731 [Helianthus annuus]KAJ0590271.1 hypothetical protein HanIR_Chr04g0195511 [Helianthus annuus]
MIRFTNRLTLGTSLEHLDRTPWRSKSDNQGRWSVQLSTPKRSYPSSTRFLSSTESTSFESTRYFLPNTDHIMLLNEARFNTSRTHTDEVVFFWFCNISTI